MFTDLKFDAIFYIICLLIWLCKSGKIEVSEIIISKYLTSLIMLTLCSLVLFSSMFFCCTSHDYSHQAKSSFNEFIQHYSYKNIITGNPALI